MKGYVLRNMFNNNVGYVLIWINSIYYQQRDHDLLELEYGRKIIQYHQGRNLDGTSQKIFCMLDYLRNFQLEQIQFQSPTKSLTSNVNFHF